LLSKTNLPKMIFSWIFYCTTVKQPKVCFLLIFCQFITISCKLTSHIFRIRTVMGTAPCFYINYLCSWNIIPKNWPTTFYPFSLQLFIYITFSFKNTPIYSYILHFDLDIFTRTVSLFRCNFLCSNKIFYVFNNFLAWR
jgi:hypothetical protein